MCARVVETFAHLCASVSCLSRIAEVRDDYPWSKKAGQALLANNAHVLLARARRKGNRMTHASLPAEKVAEACRLALLNFDELDKDDLELDARLRMLVNTGQQTAEKVISGEPFRKASRDQRINQRHQMTAMQALAIAVGKGQIVVSASDFRAIERHYRS